jgi:hypothetical protein
MLAQEPPRILLAIADDVRRGFLAAALRETGYHVIETSLDAHAADGVIDLIVTDGPAALDGPVPTLVVGVGFDVIDVEMSVLDLLGWDGPPTLRRVPVWNEGVPQA